MGTEVNSANGCGEESASNARPRTADRVQEMRERLTYRPAWRPEFDYELLAMFVKNELSASLTVPLLAIVVALTSMFWAPGNELVFWLATVLMSKGILLCLCRQFLKRGRADVATAYRNTQVPERISAGRLRRSQDLLRNASGDIDVALLQQVLRDHLDAGSAPPIDATADEERYFTLCMHSEPLGSTTASLIAALPTDRTAPWPVWVSFAAPCTSIFIPVYLNGVIPDVLARGEGVPTRDSAWWSFHALQETAASDFSRCSPTLRSAWRSLEQEIEIERVAVEATARAAAVSGDHDDAACLLTAFMERTAAAAVGRADELGALIGVER